MWIENYEEESGNHSLSRSTLPTSVKVTVYYVKNNSIIGTKSTQAQINESGVVTKEHLVEIILNNKYLTVNNSLESFNEYVFFKYNLSIETEKLFEYVDNTYDKDAYTSFNNIKDIHFESSLPILNNLNHIVILYRQRQLSHNKTKNKNKTKQKKSRTNKGDRVKNVL